MGIKSLVLLLGVFWVVVYATHYRWVRRAGRPTILPVGSADSRKPYSTRIGLNQLSLRIQYLGLNQVHDHLTSRFSRTRHSWFNRSLALFYDLGSVLGVFGMLAAILVLLDLAAKLCHANFLTAGLVAIEQQTGSIMAKRDTYSLSIPSRYHAQHRNTPHSIIQLLIPGLTVPLSHLIPLLLALFVSQVIHEIGHAVSAAIEVVPLLSVGASFTVLIPSAFVSLSSASMEKLSPRARLRIVSAGAAHNLLLWTLLASFASTGLDSTLWSIVGYQKIGHYARVITGVDPDSSLNAHLSVGVLVTHLNDEPLASLTEDVWVKYLSKQPTMRSIEDMGWCASTAWFEEHSNECCGAHRSDTGYSCFTAMVRSHSPAVDKCLPPHSILSESSATSSKRCHEPVDCEIGHVCVRPRPDEEMLRITLWVPRHLLSEGGKQEQTVLWSGPWEEVLEDVEVGTYLPYFQFQPLWFPILVNKFFWYLSTLTLSLYFFNLLPLSFLDGGQLLDAVIDLVWQYAHRSTRNESELEGLESGVAIVSSALSVTMSPKMSRAKRAVLKGGSFVMMVVMTLCGMLALWSHLSP